MHYVTFALIVAIWGSNFILMKKGTEQFAAAGVAAGRLLGGLLFLVVVLWWSRRTRPESTGRTPWRLILFCALIGYAWPYIIQPVLVARHGSAFIGLSVAFVPLLTILVSIPLLKVYPSPQQVVGVVGALLCIAGLMWDGLEREIPALDLLYAFSVPLSYAIVNTLVRRSMGHVSAVTLSASLLGVACGVMLPIAIATPSPPPAPGSSLTVSVAAIAILGLLGTGWSTIAFNRLIQSHGPLFAGMTTYLVPLGALLWGWLDQETVTPLQLGCLVGVLAMVGLTQVSSGRVLR